MYVSDSYMTSCFHRLGLGRSLVGWEINGHERNNGLLVTCLILNNISC